MFLLAFALPLFLTSCSLSQRTPPLEQPAQSTGAASSAASGSPRGAPPTPTMPCQTPFPASLSSGTLAVVALDPTGSLCVLDADAGSLRSRREVVAVDLLNDRTRPGHLVTVEPALQDMPGKLARYELRADTLEPVAELSLDAPEGRLIDAAQAIVGLQIGEGTTLFRAEAGGGVGRSWGWVVSAAAYPLGGEVMVLTAGALDQGKMWLRRVLVGNQGIPEGTWEEVEAEAGGLSVFVGKGRPGYVRAGKERLQISWAGGPLDGVQVSTPWAEVHGSMWLADRQELAVLTGPEPNIHLFGDGKHRVIWLGGEKLPRPMLPEHRIVYDPSRDRLWVAVPRGLLALALEEGEVAAEGACKAVGVTLVEQLNP
ncbi:MAG: hypothetical protein RMJ98_21655 [Myxococcales bacterium]|nr:hypothetical protein [Polyangiaceae bacterium]MDW8251910.1 hypothetical protein [Myxococcales bacterium]